MKRTTPLGALVRGLAAGAAGSAVQSLFFALTRDLAPPSRAERPAELPEAERDEQATETIARRFVEGMMARGPLEPEAKARAASLVHYATGAGFGAAWALTRESFPRLRGPLGIGGFGLAAWMVGDNLLYPAFRLGPGPAEYPLSTHAYALAAHMAYAAAAGALYEALRPRSLALAGAALWAARADTLLLPHLPRAARPAARTLVGAAARVRAEHPIETAAQALSRA